MILLDSIVKYLQAAGLELIQTGTVALTQEISGPRNNVDAGSSNYTFFNSKAGEALFPLLKTSAASLIILETSIPLENAIFPKSPYVFTASNAKQSMLEVSKHFFEMKPTPGLSPLAQIHPNAQIGNNCSIYPGVVIEAGVIIGDNCILEPNVFIQQNCKIGNRVHIKANTVLGGNGFGYVKQEDGEYVHVPHFGRVIVEDNVHIGSNTCIDRGSFSDTIIRSGVRIDNLVHIAHNVELGENTLVIANSMIAGSVRIGANTWIAPSASIKNGITIGDNVTVGLSSLVLKSVPNDDIVAGVPAKSIKK